MTRNAIHCVGKGLIALAVLGMVLTVCGARPWYLAGAAYWVPLYAAFSVTGIVCCRPRQTDAWSVAGVLSIVAAAALIAPLYLHARDTSPTRHEHNLRILQANVFDPRGDAEALVRLVRKTSPDVILLQETKRSWIEKLKPLEAEYPHHAFLPRGPGADTDLALFWRAGADTPEPLFDLGVPAASVSLPINGRAVRVLNVHTAAPFSPARAKRHREQMLALTNYMKTTDGPVVVAGDFNSSCWSHLYHVFLHESGLRRAGSGIAGTWPSPLGPLRTPLDHLFVDDHIEVVDRRVGTGIGSDHRPVITDLYVPPSVVAQAQ